MIEELVPVILTASVSVGIFAAVWFISKKLILKVALPEALQESILSVVRGPVSIAIIGYGILQATAYVEPLLPTFLKPVYLTVVLQLMILASALRVAASAVRRLMPLVTRERRAVKILVYSIYTTGLLALIQILLASPMTPEVAVNIWMSINFFTGLFVTYLVVYILNLIMERYVRAFAAREPRLETIFTFVRRLTLAIVALIGVSATVFSTFPAAGALISSLLIAAGFASIVIGLAAQSSLSNIIAGMLVSVSQPFKIGEAVLFRNEFCFVEDIKLVHSVLRTWDNRRLMVPNSLFQSEVVINYSAEDPTMLVPISVQISYESDMDRAMKIMREAALKHPQCMPIGNLPNVVVMEYGESGINLRLLSRAKDQPTAFMMARDLLYQIKKEFDANGIEIPYPRRYLVLGKEAEQVLWRVMNQIEGRFKHEHSEKADAPTK